MLLWPLLLWPLLLWPLLLIVGPLPGAGLGAEMGAGERTIRSLDLLADAAVLRKAFEQLHPGLYRYNSKAEMDAKFEALNRVFSQDVSLRDAYLALSVFAAQVKCGHTYPNFFNQRKDVATALFQGRNRVPFYFRWVDERMVVTRDFTPDHRLPRGTEVLSINGSTAAAILNRLMVVARADGANDDQRVASLEVTGASLYETFDIYFPMYFPVAGRLRLITRAPAEKSAHLVEVEPLSYDERIAPVRDREAGRKGDAVLFDWRYLKNGAAWLRMPTWAVYDSKWDWKGWLNARLDEAADRNAPALVVDLRGNEGGNDVGDEILRRVVRGPLKPTSERKIVAYRKTPADLDPFLETWDQSFRNWGAAAVAAERGQGAYELKRTGDEGGDAIRASGKPFRGKVYVLVDARNSSATFRFAQLVQQNRLGTLVGQPTGGNQRGINAGALFFLRLPKSGIEMDLPLIGYFAEGEKPDAGLIPDVLVKTELRDIAAGADVELARVEAMR